MHLRFTLLTSLTLASLPMQGALVIDGYADATNARYANDPAFIAGSSLTGLGRSIDNVNGTWASLVSPNVFVSASHYGPGVGNQVTFFATNDPAGPSITRTVIAVQQLGTSDVRLGILDTSLPAEYEPFPFLDQPISSLAEFSVSPLANAEVFMVGRAEDTVSLLENIAVGRNLLEHWFPAGSFTYQNGDPIEAPLLIAPQDPSSDPEFYVPYEAWVQTYDSGAPLLVEINGQLNIAGFNWIQFGSLSLSWRKGKPIARPATGFSVIGNVADTVQGAIEGFAIDATSGYVSWMPAAFGGSSDWSVTGPAIDADGDGLINFLEYAFVRDPLDPVNPFPGHSVVIQIDDQPFLGLQTLLRTDPRLLYEVHAGTDLSSPPTVALSFDSVQWLSADPDSLQVHQAIDRGDGTWDVTLRSALPLAPAQPAFLSIAARPLPY